MPRALAVDTRLRVVSLAAGRAGVRAGMTIPEARARCATLDVRAWDDGAIADAMLAGTTALLAASPQVTPAAGAPGMWWVGASGFDAIGGEVRLAEQLLAIAQQWHPDARVAIASSCVAARAATWAPVRDTTNAARITCIPRDACATYLAPAPLGLVPMGEDLREALTLLGLRTAGALAALDAGDVEQRWGPEGLIAWRLARGDDPRRPGLVRVEAARSTSVELPGAVESAEPILFVLRAQLQRLLQDCVHDGRAAAAVAITLVLDAGRQYPIEDIDPSSSFPLTPFTLHPDPVALNHTQHILSIPQRTITREVRPARPLARLEPLFDQCRALLEQWRIPAPIIGVTVSIPATAPLAADQGDLLVPSWRDAAMNAEAVFARLRAALDPQHVGDVVVHAEARDTHRIEESGTWVSADAMLLASAPLPNVVDAVTDTRPTAPGSFTHNAQHHNAQPTIARPHNIQPQTIQSHAATLRLLSIPDPVDVETPNTQHGTPAAIWWRGQRLDITHAHGPERLSGDWWRGDGYARDYWRCCTDNVGELLLFHEDRQWYVQGWYD